MHKDWPALVPLDAPALPAFPLEALPPPFRDYASALAESVQVPADLPAMLMLTVGGATIAKHVYIQANSEWREPTNLYTVVALPPANRKSAIFNAVTAPLEHIEKLLTQEACEKAKETRRQREIQEAALETVRREAVKATAAGDSLAYKRVVEMEDDLPPLPHVPRILADDVSPEKLATLLAENDGRIAIQSPEGGLFEQMGGRYNNNIPNLDVYLKGHSGDNLRVDRVNRKTEFIKKPALTIGLTVQPDVLNGLVKKPGFRGRGLLARFLYSVPESLVGRRQVVTPAINPHVRIAYENSIRRVYQQAASLGSSHHVVLTLSQTAKSHFRKFCEDLELTLGPGGALEPTSDWGGKLSGQTLRIAAILHIYERGNVQGNMEISESTIHNAILIAMYLREHALAAFDLMGADPELDKARRIIQWFQGKHLSQFSAREAFQALKGQFQQMRFLTSALDVLVERGYLRCIQVEKQVRHGRPSSPVHEVNPRASSISSESSKSRSFGYFEDSEDIGDRKIGLRILSHDG
jgi:hypothetical protein